MSTIIIDDNMNIFDMKRRKFVYVYRDTEKDESTRWRQNITQDHVLFDRCFNSLDIRNLNNHETFHLRETNGNYMFVPSLDRF